jgi:hypothetical protein
MAVVVAVARPLGRYESELIHNLTISMFDSDFTEHDIYFLNFRGRAYARNCSERLPPLYPQQLERLERAVLAWARGAASQIAVDRAAVTDVWLARQIDTTPVSR